MSTIYLWSVLGSVKAAGIVISLLLAVLLLFVGVARLEGDAEQLARVPVKSMLVMFFVSLFCAVFVPTADDLFRAQLIFEASKVTTAENAGKLADEILKRIDKALEKR